MADADVLSHGYHYYQVAAEHRIPLLLRLARNLGGWDALFYYAFQAYCQFPTLFKAKEMKRIFLANDAPYRVNVFGLPWKRAVAAVDGWENAVLANKAALTERSYEIETIERFAQVGKDMRPESVEWVLVTVRKGADVSKEWTGDPTVSLDWFEKKPEMVNDEYTMRSTILALASTGIIIGPLKQLKHAES